MSAVSEMFKTLLQQDLADATELVWRMQNALSESKTDTIDPDVSAACEVFMNRAGSIAGYVSRWMMWDEQEKRNAERG